MTYGRMIRVDDEPEHDKKFAKAILYYSKDGVFTTEDHVVTFFVYRDMTEITPSKEWRPHCWTPDCEIPNKVIFCSKEAYKGCPYHLTESEKNG